MKAYFITSDLTDKSKVYDIEIPVDGRKYYFTM